MTRRYLWECTQHIDDIELTTANMLPSSLTRTRPATTATGPATDSFLFTAFAYENLTGHTLPSGAVAVRCPWFVEHSDGRGDGKDSSTVLLAPTSAAKLGHFKCSHGHCSQRRLADVLTVLSKGAIDAASRAHARAFGCVVTLLSRGLR